MTQPSTDCSTDLRYSTDTSLLNTWLENGLIPMLPEKSVIIMDNARFHQSDKTRSLIEPQRTYAFILTGLFTRYNPIEQYWAIMKSKIKKCMADFFDLYACVEFVFRTA